MINRLDQFIKSGKTLSILADENMPGVNEYFSSKGLVGLSTNIRKISGRKITAEDLKDVHVLLIRSVTKVDQSLLLDCPELFFIGSATIGVNHVDQTLLKSRGVQFEYAPGCNAQGVAEYVLSAIALHRPDVFENTVRKVGLVGFGNTGSRVFSILNHLNVDVIVYDPFKENSENPHVNFVSYEEVLCADVVSFHVPYTDVGEFPTKKMLDKQSLRFLKEDALLINTSRGDVFNQSEVYDCFSSLKTKKAKCLVLDVWENEPDVDPCMVEICNSATSHIAGYTWEGKWRGTLQLYQKLCRFMSLEDVLSDRLFPAITKNISFEKDLPWYRVFNLSYSIQKDSESLRGLINNDSLETDLGEQFDLLRKNYPQRCEWQNIYFTNDDLDLSGVSVFEFFQKNIYKHIK